MTTKAAKAIDKSSTTASKSSSNNAPLEPKQPADIEASVPSQSASLSSKYIISPIMPTEEVHLIGGPSGAGKTTLLFQMIEDWAQSRPVFGYDSHPSPFLYIPCDRSQASTERTIERIGCKVHIPVYSLVDHNVPCTIDNISRVAREELRVPVSKHIVLFIDAFGTLVPGGKINDYATVGSWLREVNRKCKREKMTIIGLGHSTKTKEGEKFDNPRQRFLGSVAWGGFVDTMIFIEPESADDPTNTTRRILVLPRNSAELCLHYHFNSSGRLIDGEMEAAEFQLEQFAKSLDPGAPTSIDVFLKFADSISTSKRTVERWLPNAVTSGILEKLKRGVYRRPYKS